jgi:dynein heavy chain
MEVDSGPPRERYRCLREKVLALVRGYNQFLSQLTPQECRLFSERLVFLDRKMGPGLSKLTWNAKAQLDVYL